MSARTRSRWRWAAGCVLAASAGPAAAQTPRVISPPAAAPTPAVEFYYGVTRVPAAAEPMPEPEPELLPASATVAADDQASARSGEALVAALHAVRDGSESVSYAARVVLDRLADRVMRSHDSRPTFVLAYAPPAPAPVPTPLPAAPAPAPQVVVVREPAAAEAAPAAGLPLTPALLMAVGGVALGTGLLGAAAARLRRPAAPAVNVLPMPVAAPADGSLNLLGRYNAGRAPETAEKFEVGPTFQEEKAQAELAKAAGEQAVVQFILEQNLALQDAVGAAGGDERWDRIPVATPAAGGESPV